MKQGIPKCPPPRSIRISGKEWAVKRVRTAGDLGGACGTCDYTASTISFASSLSPFDQKDTLLHEVFHALLAQQTTWDRPVEEEERYILSLATGLTGVLQDNPEFAQWLTTLIPKPK
jgi:hypothetical protein